MKLSLRPATLFFPPFFSRVTGLHRIMALLLLSGFLFLPLMAEAGLPQAAISIPTDRNLAAGLKAAEQCEFPGKQIVLPPLSFDLTGSEKPSSLFEEQAQGVRSMPEGSEIWLHVVVRANSLTGDESEKQITERVNTFLKPMLLSAPAVRGLIVEIESSQPLTAPDRFAFALARLALTAKASSAGLRLAFVFQPGFIGQHGDLVRRLATYSDLLGTTYSPGWRRDAAWIAEQALNKPLILKSESRTSPFLTAMLAASGTSVEIVWAEPADAKAADAVCTANSLMAHSITANMFPADASSSPFSVEVDGVLNNEHQWSGGGKSDVVIVAHVNGSPDSPKMVRLLGGRAGPFEIKWYDPATGAQLPAGEATKTDKGFVQTCACTSEYAVISIRQQSEADQTLYN
ncbi:MAG: hypothetical protein WA899_23045, partial [Candidatus Sulfotelmatobacter sp.]